MLLSASPSEGFGYTYVEAMMCRCPVVAHPTGILAEAPAENGPVAKLLPLTATLADFAEAVRGAAGKDFESGRRVALGCKWALEHFTEEAAGRRWRRFLLGLAGASKQEGAIR